MRTKRDRAKQVGAPPPQIDVGTKHGKTTQQASREARIDVQLYQGETSCKRLKSPHAKLTTALPDALKEVQRVYSLSVKQRARERLVTVKGALRRTFQPDFFPSDLSTIPRLAEKARGFPLPFVGFNGQFVRTSVLLKLIRALSCDVFVETGTDTGETCLLMAAQTRLPIFSCELSQSRHELAAKYLAPLGNRIHLRRDDSRKFLSLFLKAPKYRRPLFYLDAHWNTDIPLLEELQLILGQLEDFVIVIDDFKVPSDPGFKFDVYDEACFDEYYISGVLHGYATRVSISYPSYPSQLETGSKRGFLLILPCSIESQVRRTIGTDFLSQTVAL